MPSEPASQPDGFTVTYVQPGWYDLRNQNGTAVAEAVRYTRAEGAGFSGWIVRGLEDCHSDPIPNVGEARAALAVMPDTLRSDRYGRPRTEAGFAAALASWRER